MDKMFDLDYETRSFKPTIQWMRQRYDEANQKLFNLKLGGCEFGIFTTGKGSRGSTNGWFRLTGNGLYIDRYSRRLFKKIGWSEDEKINYGNFPELAKPKIELNGNKSGSEWAFMVTLVHEMCHYYTYMNGRVPPQGHGPEFVSIANEITSRSNGQIEVTKKATLERMRHFVVDDKIDQINKKAAATKRAKTTALVVFKQGETRLVMTSSEKLIYDITNIESKRKDTIQITRSNDADLIDTLINDGYRSLMRTYRFWNITNNKDLINLILNSEGREVYENPELSGEMPNTQKLSASRLQPQEQPQNTTPKRMFTIKTSNGTFEYDGTVYASLFKALRERFPKMSDGAIKKIMNNPANYRVMENKQNTKDIIREVIEEFMQNEFRGANNGDVAEITPDMNLSEFSPLEME